MFSTKYCSIFSWNSGSMKVASARDLVKETIKCQPWWWMMFFMMIFSWWWFLYGDDATSSLGRTRGEGAWQGRGASDPWAGSGTLSRTGSTGRPGSLSLSPCHHHQNHLLQQELGNKSQLSLFSKWSIDQSLIPCPLIAAASKANGFIKLSGRNDFGFWFSVRAN